jgi:4-amino-4-deoxy-L-arabinose transferase-like glycosyltransferase
MPSNVSPVAIPFTAARSTRWKGALPAVLICLGINLIIGIAIAAYRPEYLRDYRYNSNPDAIHYVRLGRNFLVCGHYSRCLKPPYVPDSLRTPVYPLFAGGFDLVGGAAAVYGAQAVLHAGSCVLLFLLVRRYFGRRTALWASLLLATDLMLAISNFEAMSEPLFAFLLLAAAVWLIPAAIPTGSELGPARDFLIGGLLLSLAILTRPAGLYLPLLYTALLLGQGLVHRCLPRALRFAGLLLAVTFLPVAAWVARNYAVSSLPRLSSSEAIMLVYFTGAGAYQVEHGLTLDEAQQRIREEFYLAPPDHTNNHWLTTRSVAEMDAELRAAVRPVLTRYPKALLLSSALAVIKATFSHNVGLLADALGAQWIAPSTSGLFRLKAAAFGRLGQNNLILVLAFGWQLAHNALTWGWFPAGVIIALRRRDARCFTLLLLLALAYFLLTVALVGPEAYYRSRTPHMPLVFALAGVALGAVRWRHKRGLGLVPKTSRDGAASPCPDCP